jgi:hypothetical protein
VIFRLGYGKKTASPLSIFEINGTKTKARQFKASQNRGTGFKQLCQMSRLGEEGCVRFDIQGSRLGVFMKDMAKAAYGITIYSGTATRTLKSKDVRIMTHDHDVSSISCCLWSRGWLLSIANLLVPIRFMVGLMHMPLSTPPAMLQMLPLYKIKQCLIARAAVAFHPHHRLAAATSRAGPRGPGLRGQRFKANPCAHL